MAIAALIAFGFSRITNLNFWIALLMVILSMAINGWIATKEDDAPGGFNNPNEKQRGKRPHP